MSMHFNKSYLKILINNFIFYVYSYIRILLTFELTFPRPFQDQKESITPFKFISNFFVIFVLNKTCVYS